MVTCLDPAPNGRFCACMLTYHVLFFLRLLWSPRGQGFARNRFGARLLLVPCRECYNWHLVRYDILAIISFVYLGDVNKIWENCLTFVLIKWILGIMSLFANNTRHLSEMIFKSWIIIDLHKPLPVPDSISAWQPRALNEDVDVIRTSIGVHVFRHLLRWLCSRPSPSQTCPCNQWRFTKSRFNY